MTAPLRWMARGEHEIPDHPGWLSAREAERMASLRFSKRRTEYLLRRWVGKQAVASATGFPATLPDLARIELANHPSGAPYVLVDGDLLGLDVSLTDRAGWAVCLVGHDMSRLGCDLEIVETRSDGFVRDFLTEPEQVYVRSLPDADARHAAANLLWSAKESALKVLRTGLRRDTRSVEVVVGERDDSPEVGGWGRLSITAVEGTVFSGWWRREGVFLITLATDDPIPPPVEMPGSAGLRDARPIHSWVDQPLVSGWSSGPA